MDSVQLGIMIANLATVVVICFQLRSARHGRRTEDMFTLMEFLHRPHFREARMTVLADEWPTNPADYQAAHKNIAWTICSSFDFAGLMVYQDLVDTDVFYKYWSIPIVAVARKLEAFFVAQRFIGDAGNDFEGLHYWPYYHILVIEARNRLPKVRAEIAADQKKLARKEKTRLMMSTRGYVRNWFERIKKDLEKFWKRLQRGDRR
jgi:hypothetical protein